MTTTGIDPVADRMRAQYAAARAMLAALQSMWKAYGDNLERHGEDGDRTWTDTDHAEWRETTATVSAAIAQAAAAGIKTKA